MENDIKKLQVVWNKVKNSQKNPFKRIINFDEIISPMFATGPFYYFFIDYVNMSLSKPSKGFKEAHGINLNRVKSVYNILELISPDDVDFVLKAEEKALNFVKEKIGQAKFTRYKSSYNFRLKTPNGDYRLFNHQSLLLKMDKNYRFLTSLIIHTDISHLTCENNHKFSLIGIAGEPSYLNLDVYESKSEDGTGNAFDNMFTKRELEIIKLLADGHNTRSISEKLFISPSTAETHRKNILRKSGCENSVMLVARSVSEGWI